VAGFVESRAGALDLKLLVLGHPGEQDLGEVVASSKSASLVPAQGPTKVGTSSLVDVETCFHFPVAS
jgi:hypothetical protein